MFVKSYSYMILNIFPHLIKVQSLFLKFKQNPFVETKHTQKTFDNCCFYQRYFISICL